MLAATRRLHNSVIPDVAAHTLDAPFASMTNVFVTVDTLQEMLHGAGVNMRYVALSVPFTSMFILHESRDHWNVTLALLFVLLTGRWLGEVRTHCKVYESRKQLLVAMVGTKRACLPGPCALHTTKKSHLYRLPHVLRDVP